MKKVRTIINFLLSIGLFMTVWSCERESLAPSPAPEPEKEPVSEYRLEVTPGSASMSVDGWQRFKAFLMGYRDSVQVSSENVTRFVDWSSDDLDVAKVNGTGLVTGLPEGMAKITAIYSNDSLHLSSSSTVSVGDDIPLSLELQPESAVLYTYKGLNEYITQMSIRTLNCTYTDDSVRSLKSYEVSWHSADPAVAEVSDYGLVTAKGEGFTDIVASYEESGVTVTAICRVMVVDNGPSQSQDYVTGASGWVSGERFGLRIDSMSDGTKGVNVPFTYEVVFSESDISFPLGQKGACGVEGCPFDSGTSSVTVSLQSVIPYPVSKDGSTDYLRGTVQLSIL
jgi:hypothetical protein